METELLIKDLETIEKRIDKISKSVRVGEKNLKHELDLLLGLKNHMSQSRLAHYFTKELDAESKEIIRPLFLLTDVPVLYVANVDEKNVLGNEYSRKVEEIAQQEEERSLTLSVQIESEIANLESREEKMLFLKDLGLEESGLNRLVKESYKLLRLITFFTANEKELHSWTILNGLKAPQAAGKIHTDFEHGFIRAEIMKYKDIIELKSELAVREKGLMHVEGKEYMIEDGDIVYFRFNV